MLDPQRVTEIFQVARAQTEGHDGGPTAGEKAAAAGAWRLNGV